MSQQACSNAGRGVFSQLCKVKRMQRAPPAKPTRVRAAAMATNYNRGRPTVGMNSIAFRLYYCVHDEHSIAERRNRGRCSTRGAN